MKEIKKLLWFILPFMGWIGTKYVFTRAGMHIDDVKTPGVLAMWWAISCILSVMATIALAVLAGSKQ